jgi:DNA modification methylase
LEELINKLHGKYTYEYLGGQLLIQGDCLEVMELIDDKSVDCVMTSPPYWKGFEYEAYFNSYLQYIYWCKSWLKKVKEILSINGTLYLNVINDSEITIRAFELMEIATRELMYKLHDTIIWYRYNQQPANTTRQLTNQCEYIFMLRHSSSGICLNKELAYEKNPDMFETKNVGNVWKLPFNSGKNNSTFGRKETKSKYGHSGFPVKLPETCILLSTDENNIICDPFAGSFTTTIACIRTNRQSICIEKDEEYYKLGVARVKEELRQEDMFRVC